MVIRAIIALSRTKQNAVSIINQPCIFLSLRSRAISHAIDRAKRCNDLVTGILHRPVFQRHFRRFTQINRADLIFPAIRANTVGTLIDGQGERAAIKRLLIAFKRCAVCDTVARQFIDEGEVDRVTLLFGKVFFDLNNRVLRCSHLTRKAVFCETFHEELIVPLLDG